MIDRLRRLAPALFLLALAPAEALASAEYPEAMKADLDLSRAPGCDLCHPSAADPVGPAETPFAQSAMDRGLVGGDVASLTQALDRMRADGVDSDGDGAEDLDELSWEGDPNHADLPEAGRLQTVTYGCAWSGGAAEGWRAPIVLAALLGLVRRRGRAQIRPCRSAAMGSMSRWARWP